MKNNSGKHLDDYAAYRAIYGEDLADLVYPIQRMIGTNYEQVAA